MRKKGQMACAGVALPTFAVKQLLVNPTHQAAMQQVPPEGPVLPVQGSEGVIHAGKKADMSELKRAVPLDLGCMEAALRPDLTCYGLTNSRA
ncbi:TPA: hypothetical protein ACH3X3_012619 [Trebouxia sp. C0006]